MSHGKNISTDHAVASIKKFVLLEQNRTGREEEKIVVGHQIDLALIKTMIAEIDRINNPRQEIDCIRIYFGIDSRDGKYDPEEYDVILVPTFSNNRGDLHTIYELVDKGMELPTLIGKSTPCPNVCEQKNLPCSSGSI